MTDPTEAVLQYLQHVGAGLDPDFLREAIKVMSALLMEVEVQQRIGADHYERTDQRTTYRNGYAYATNRSVCTRTARSVAVSCHLPLYVLYSVASFVYVDVYHFSEGRKRS
jgi:hypothetical protein